jgi:hypothetical protein
MTKNPALPFQITMAVLVAYFAIVFVLTYRLKARHPEAWREKTGGFTLFLHNSIGSGWKSLRYLIFTNEHRELGDPVVDKLSNAVRVVAVCYLACLVWYFWDLSHTAR